MLIDLLLEKFVLLRNCYISDELEESKFPPVASNDGVHVVLRVLGTHRLDEKQANPGLFAHWSIDGKSSISAKLLILSGLISAIFYVS